jgi:hypothetical protein
VQQHHREQAVDLRLVGHQLRERAAEPERLGRQLAAATVALVEDQVDDREHRGEPIGQQVVGRHPERDPGGLDLALGPHEPLGHRRLGDEEGSGDLAGGQAAEGVQGQSDLRVGGQRGVTAGEDELQSLVGERPVGGVDRRRRSPLLVLRKPLPLLGRRRRGGALMDQQHVLHRVLLGGWSLMRRTSSDESTAAEQRANAGERVRGRRVLRVELAGLEPATSWVPSRASGVFSSARLQGF